VLITNISDLSLQYDEVLGLLRVEWASGQDMRNFRASAQQLTQVANRLQVRHLLLDMNTFPDISVYDQVWLGVNWMPLLLDLPLERMVIVINRRRVHNQLAVDSLISMARPYIRFDIQFFSAAAPGMHWLSDHSDQIPGLLAEWEAVFGPGLLSSAGGVAEARPSYLSGM
jgi:hypothetical protein